MSGSGPGEPVARLDRGELLVRHREGDREAFGRLVRHYRRPVASYLARVGVAEADRDDLFQEIFLRVHRAATSYDPSRPLHPWLFTIVANAVRNHLRRLRVRSLVEGEPPAVDPPDERADGEATAMSRQAMAIVAERLGSLPALQRQVLLLVTVQGLTPSEVASALSLNPNTLKTYLRRARLALARAVTAARGGEEVTP